MEVEYILCIKCKGTGFLTYDGVKNNCPICDCDPKITYETIAEYARQLDKLTKDLFLSRREVNRLTCMLTKIKNILG